MNATSRRFFFFRSFVPVILWGLLLSLVIGSGALAQTPPARESTGSFSDEDRSRIVPVPGTENVPRQAPNPYTLVPGIAKPEDRLRVQVDVEGRPVVLNFDSEELLRRVANRRTTYEYVREPLYLVFSGLAKLMNRGFEFPYTPPSRPGSQPSGLDISTATVTARYENMTPSEVFFRIAKSYGFVVRDTDGILRLIAPNAVQREDMVPRVYRTRYVNLYNYFTSVRAMLSPVGQIYVNTMAAQGGKVNELDPKKVFGQLSAGDPSQYNAGGAGSGGGGGGSASPSVNSDAQRRDAVLPNNSFSYTVIDLPEVHEQIAAFLGEVDRPKRQIQVQMRLYEWSRDMPGDGNRVGLDWSSLLSGYDVSAGNRAAAPIAGQGGVEFPLNGVGNLFFPGPTTMIVQADRLRASIHLLSTNAKAKLKDSPSIIAQHGVTTFMRSVRRVPYLDATATNQGGGSSTSTQQIKFVDIGTTLNVTPFIEDDQDPDPSQWTLYLDLKPEITAQAGTVLIGNNPVPQFTARAPTTQVRIRNGDTVLLGGLTSDRIAATTAGVPWLKDLPLIGALFGTKSEENANSEMVMMVTADILDLGNKTLPSGLSDPTRQWIVNNERKGPDYIQVSDGTPVDLGMGMARAPAVVVPPTPEASRLQVERRRLEQERQARVRLLNAEFQARERSLMNSTGGSAPDRLPAQESGLTTARPVTRGVGGRGVGTK
jgi:type II secretory pathway component GspD/PulD (secretin)